MPGTNTLAYFGDEKKFYDVDTRLLIDPSVSPDSVNADVDDDDDDTVDTKWNVRKRKNSQVRFGFDGSLKSF